MRPKTVSKALASKALGSKLGPSGSLRSRKWKRFLRGPDPALLEELYVPALGQSIRYSRCCSYFSSSVLAAAARGFGPLIGRLESLGGSAPRPAVRLVVNEELLEEDVRALTETGDTSKLEAVLRQRFKTPRDLLEKQRLAMLGWLAKCGLLEVRVGVMRQGGGIVHAKFGIATDEAGDSIVFSGSGNESAQGLLANYERLEVSTSWNDPDRYAEYAREFEALWADSHADVHTVTLPEALRLKLVKFAPKQAPAAEPSNVLPRQKAAMVWQLLVEAPYFPEGQAACDGTAMVELWPHQKRVVEEVSQAWPEGRLLCDEVGMGKTIEAILVLRRLMAGRGVRRVLILLPAGLVKQWQGELREKGGLVFPRLEGNNFLVWPDESVKKMGGLSDAFEQDLLLMSRELARLESNMNLLLEARPWDMVIMDEAHAARRRRQEEGEFNSGTLLLNLLRQLQLRRKARGILLLSATPMQTHPWEPWDLLAVLGEGGRWLAEFMGVRDYYDAVAAFRRGSCDLATARRAAALIAADSQFPTLPGDGRSHLDIPEIANRIAFATPGQRPNIVDWLRLGSPLARRMHRNTRDTLRHYFALGLLQSPPPRRNVEDIQFDYLDAPERVVYDSVRHYIDRRFEELEREKPGKGFVMTIYQRRASSSPQALQRSLQRRRDGLKRVAERKAYDEYLIAQDEPEAMDPSELPEGEVSSRVSAALPSDSAVARAELAEVDDLLGHLQSLGGRDSKLECFFDCLRRVTEDGRAVLVFTEYVDTLEYLRDALVGKYRQGLACYRGDGGHTWDGTSWITVTKDKIRRSLDRGEVQAMICTDAASEGLNLQAASAVINYDLPWNPSKVEQRIGRIDRIGQKEPEVRVINLFLKDSVDDQVYRVLRQRCGLFERFVGPMQPVLARARRMLLGQDSEDVKILEAAATGVDQDAVATEIYLDSPAGGGGTTSAVLSLPDMLKALEHLNSDVGLRVRLDNPAGLCTISGSGFSKTTYAFTVDALERDRSALPLSPLDQRIRGLAEKLVRPGERLSLVIGSHQSGVFRASVAYWVSRYGSKPVQSMAQLRELVDTWDGFYPDPSAWLKVQSQAKAEAECRVKAMEALASERENAGLKQQQDAARLRLLKELGRYLACVAKSRGFDASDLSTLWHQLMMRDTASSARLKQCYDKLVVSEDWPAWEEDLRQEVTTLAERLTENQVNARLLGKEVDAALLDPRWQAKVG